MADQSKRFTLEIRKRIEELLKEGRFHYEIAEIVGISRSAIYREVKKCKEFYSAEEAHKNTSQGMKKIDFEITGKRFGLLIVIEYVNKIKGRTWWKCKCDCGRTCIISRKILIERCSDKRPLSCGCIAKQWGGPGKEISFEEASLRKFQDLMVFRRMNGDCWEWTGYMQKGKVPKTSWKNKAMTVRKCMYLLIHGTTYEPNQVYSRCGNLRCFNPDHLTLDKPPRSKFHLD